MKLNRTDYQQLTDDEFELLEEYAEPETSLDELYHNLITVFDDGMSEDAFNTLEDIDNLIHMSTLWSHMIHAVKDRLS